MSGLDVVELLGVEDALTIVGEKRRHCGYDIGPIRTGQGQDKLIVEHGTCDGSD
jgi:hypothetical protein